MNKSPSLKPMRQQRQEKLVTRNNKKASNVGRPKNIVLRTLTQEEKTLYDLLCWNLLNPIQMNINAFILRFREMVMINENLNQLNSKFSQVGSKTNPHFYLQEQIQSEVSIEDGLKEMYNNEELNVRIFVQKIKFLLAEVFLRDDQVIVFTELDNLMKEVLDDTEIPRDSNYYPQIQDRTLISQECWDKIKEYINASKINECHPDVALFFSDKSNI